MKFLLNKSAHTHNSGLAKAAIKFCAKTKHPLGSLRQAATTLAVMLKTAPHQKDRNIDFAIHEHKQSDYSLDTK